MLRVLVANVFFAPHSYGGATIVAEALAERLEQSGRFHVSVVSLCVRPELPPFAAVKTQIRGIDSYLINVPGQRSFRDSYHNPSIDRRIAGLLQTLQPDILHAHCLQDIGIGVLQAAQQAGVRTLVSVHDYWWICERQFLVGMNGTACGKTPKDLSDCAGCVANLQATQERRDRLMAALRHVDMITYPSKASREICEASGLPPDIGVVMENGINTLVRDCSEPKRDQRRRDGPLVFGYLGGPSFIKGWPWIREAFAGIGRDDFRVELVDGSLDQTWWRPADIAGLPGSWRIRERFEQAGMDTFYDGIDVLLFPSQWPETFGLAVREALARGVSVIGTARGSLAEVARAGQMRLCSGPVSLRTQIEACLDAGRQARVPVRMRSFDVQAAQLAGLLRSVVRGKPVQAVASDVSDAKGKLCGSSVSASGPVLMSASSCAGAAGS